MVAGSYIDDLHDIYARRDSGSNKNLWHVALRRLSHRLHTSVLLPAPSQGHSMD
jgi:hypothetical protein